MVTIVQRLGRLAGLPWSRSRVPPFSRVYRDEHDFVWRCLARMGVPDADLEDATQDVFLVVHAKLPTFEGRARVRTWIFEIVRRVASGYRTRAQRRPDHAEALLSIEDPRRLEEAVARAQAREILDAFLESLDGAKRDAFVLAELEGMTGREMAETLGINENTAAARLRAARRELSRLVHRLQARDRELRVPAPEAVVRLAGCPTPPRHQRKDTWGLLAAQIGIGSGLAPKIALAAAVVVVVGVGGGVGIGRVQVEQTSAAIGMGSEDPAPSRAGDLAAGPGNDTAPTEVPDPRPAEPATSPTPAPNVAPTSTRRRAPRTEPGPMTPSGLELLHEAKLLLARNESGAALQRLDAWQRDHAGSELADLAMVLRIEATCRMGELARLPALRRAFDERWPKSNLRPRAHAECGNPLTNPGASQHP